MPKNSPDQAREAVRRQHLSRPPVGGFRERVDDIVISRQPIVGLVQDDAERLYGELTANAGGGVAPLDLAHSGRRRRWSARGVRHFLAEEEGQGYWDFFRPSDELIVSVTDATYRKDAWVHVEGDGFFKLRLLLSGELRSEAGAVLAKAPQALLFVSPGPGREGYFIVAGQPTHMVVLHCRPRIISDVLGLEPAEVPPPVDALFGECPVGRRCRVAFGPTLMHAAQRILDSRYQLSAPLRGPYLEALGMEILTQMLGELESQTRLQRFPSTLNARDLNRIYEARDYLTQHYARPPSIPQLARLVGVNQTKLKAGFRQATGLTVYDFVLRSRMERAAELLLTGAYTIGEVAYEVGYEYPANFTHAFKRFHGRLPRAWKGALRGTGAA